MYFTTSIMIIEGNETRNASSRGRRFLDIDCKFGTKDVRLRESSLEMFRKS